MANPANDTQIRAVIDDWAEGIRSKDTGRVMSHSPVELLQFTLAPPLIAKDTGGEGLREWFATWDGRLELEITDLAITAGDDVAFATSINRLAGLKKGEGRNEIWFRQTLGLRKAGGEWKIVHLHESVPFYMDGSMRAAVDLKP